MSAEVGDMISVTGPGLIQGLNLESDWFFLVADMTSLPALSAKLRTLPETAVGHAVVQINSAEDKQTLDGPQGIKVTWLIEDTTSESLSQTVRNTEWLEGQVSVWTACEFESMRELRQYFRSEKEVPKENIYISSYWKRGVTEDGHKVLKRQDVQAFAD
jgi:NADPH-dependent ferric siderophore reductase